MQPLVTKVISLSVGNPKFQLSAELYNLVLCSATSFYCDTVSSEASSVPADRLSSGYLGCGIKDTVAESIGQSLYMCKVDLLATPLTQSFPK